MPQRPTRLQYAVARRTANLKRALAIREAVLGHLLVGSITKVQIGEFAAMRAPGTALAHRLGVSHCLMGKLLHIEWNVDDADFVIEVDGEALRVLGVQLARFVGGCWDEKLLALINSGERKAYKPGTATQAALQLLTAR
jgi:hypothetical protein